VFTTVGKGIGTVRLPASDLGGEERLTTGYLAEPAGLPARARLEATPEAGAANLLAQ